MRGFCLCMILLLTGMALAQQPPSTAEALFERARSLDKADSFFKARHYYQKALTACTSEEKTRIADACRSALTRIRGITETYALTEQDLRKQIKQLYPDITDSLMDKIFVEKRLAHLEIAGTVYYFTDSMNTLYHLYPALRQTKQPGALGRVHAFLNTMDAYVHDKETLTSGQIRHKPLRFEVSGRVVIPADILPDSGLLQVWLPLPIVTANQPCVEILDLYPRQHVVYPIQQDGDIGLVYLEIPLAEAQRPLRIGFTLRLRHFAQRFTFDREIAAYDRESWLYKRYTASAGNIALTPGIRERAVRLAGEETNPLEVARRFYAHVVYELDYSFTPHLALSALNIPESEFVLHHGYGDCGAQSMYFAALCRAVGIPARVPGGWQLFPGPQSHCGAHFWAQIFLPNYGWVPVDTSVGQLAKYMDGIQEQKREAFIHFFFGNLDPFRYVIQTDVDIPFVPDPGDALLFDTVLQMPAVLCREKPALVFYVMDHWQMQAKPVEN